MKKLLSSIIGTYIYVTGNPKPVKILQNLIINPSNGVVLGIVVDSRKGLVVVMRDIVYLGEIIQVKDNDCFVNFSGSIFISYVKYL